MQRSVRKTIWTRSKTEGAIPARGLVSSCPSACDYRLPRRHAGRDARPPLEADQSAPRDAGPITATGRCANRNYGHYSTAGGSGREQADQLRPAVARSGPDAADGVHQQRVHRGVHHFLGREAVIERHDQLAEMVRDPRFLVTDHPTLEAGFRGLLLPSFVELYHSSLVQAEA